MDVVYHSFSLESPFVSSAFTNDNVFKGSSECLTSSQTSKFRGGGGDESRRKQLSDIYRCR